MTFTELKDKICKLSKKDRDMLIKPTLQKEYLVQSRNLKLRIDEDEDIDMLNYEYLLKLAGSVTYIIDRFGLI